MAEPRRPRVPDPSATIPDFGPRPDVRVLEKRAEVIRMLEGDSAVAAPAAAAPGAAAVPARRASPILVLLLAVLVAIIAGSASFFVIVFAGLVMYALMGI